MICHGTIESRTVVPSWTCRKEGEDSTTMGKWEQLVTVRKHLQLSQEEAAERLGVELTTYRRWELGRQQPQPRHLRMLCEQFDLQLVCDEQEVWSEDWLAPACAETIADVHPAESVEVCSMDPLVNEEDQALPALLATRLTAHLWSLVLGTHATCDEKRAAVRRTIEVCDSMNNNDTNYQITRREAISTLATLPLVTLGLAQPGKEMIVPRYAEALAHSAAGLEACWELYTHGGGASELLLGFQCVSRYLDMLVRIGRTSSRHQKEALRLATQYGLLKMLFGQHCASAPATIQYARETVALSMETGELSLQLSAYSKLAWAQFSANNGHRALTAAQTAQALLEHSEQQPGGKPLPPCIRGGIYSTLATMQARNGRPSDQALAKAMEHDPGMEVYAYLDFTRASMFLEAGYTCCYQDNQARAMELLQQRVDPETFVPRMPGVTEVGRVETLHLLALSSLKAPQRDLERIIHFWQAAVEGAKTLHSEYFFALASATYEHLTLVWPGERRVLNLREHLVYWEYV